MSIETYGKGERLRHAARLLGLENPKGRLILLPVPTTRDKKQVTNTEILLEDIIRGADSDSLIVGYGIPEAQALLARESGALLLDLSCDEKYLYENAKITAVGAVGYILTTSQRAPCDLCFGIVGYGRIGSALVRMLLFLGARVRVFTSRSLTRLELGEYGVSASPYCDLEVGGEDFSDIDILINTAPKDMSEHFKEGKIPSGMRVLELASGENFRGISGVEFLPSLPEKMYPESAGRAYYGAVMRFLNSNTRK